MVERNRYRTDRRVIGDRKCDRNEFRQPDRLDRIDEDCEASGITVADGESLRSRCKISEPLPNHYNEVPANENHQDEPE